jgi:hypothetical protein
MDFSFLNVSQAFPENFARLSTERQLATLAPNAY